MTQEELGKAIGLAQSTISLIERGHLDALAMRTIRAAFAAVDSRAELVVSWRGGALDSLLDERHARLAGAVSDALRHAGWVAEIEVSYSVYGERGSIDIGGVARAIADAHRR